MSFLLCPTCKTGDGNVSIYGVTVTLTVYENGTDIERQDHEYDNSNPSSCVCGWEGNVGDLLDGDLLTEDDYKAVRHV